MVPAVFECGHIVLVSSGFSGDQGTLMEGDPLGAEWLVKLIPLTALGSLLSPDEGALS